MQISSIVDIVEGNLLGFPSISFIYNIKTKINKIQEGDLFISNNESEIQEAIKKGAFGIIFDTNISICDKEIAWIKVNDINVALSKLIRFKLSTYELEAFYCNDFTFELLNIFTKNNENSIKLISHNLEEETSQFEDFENCKTIICSSKEILNRIYPNHSNFNNQKYLVKNLIEHSLFETTFSYENNYFPRLKLSSLYINEFLKVFTFLNKNIDLLKLKRINTFKPLFIDKYFKMVDYGYSDKFILSNIDISSASIEINHLKNKYAYAKKFIFAKKRSNIENNSIDHFINNLFEIKDCLENKKFNAIYIIGFTQNEIIDFITKNSTKSLL